MHDWIPREAVVGEMISLMLLKCVRMPELVWTEIYVWLHPFIACARGVITCFANSQIG